MIEAAMLWNVPNNKSHWDPELDPEWRRFADVAGSGRFRRLNRPFQAVVPTQKVNKSV